MPITYVNTSVTEVIRQNNRNIGYAIWVSRGSVFYLSFIILSMQKPFGVILCYKINSVKNKWKYDTQREETDHQ